MGEISTKLEIVNKLMKVSNEQVAEKILLDKDTLKKVLKMKDSEIPESVLFKVYYYATRTAENRKKMEKDCVLKNQNIRALKEACVKEIKVRRAEKRIIR